MARTFKDSPNGKDARSRAGKGRQRHISVRSVRRDPPDLRRLGRAVIAFALEQAAAEAAAEATRTQNGDADEPAHEEPADDD